MRMTCGSMNALPTSTQLKRSSLAFRDMTPSSRNLFLTCTLSRSVRNVTSEGDRGVIQNETRPQASVNIPSWNQSVTLSEGSYWWMQNRSHEDEYPCPARPSLGSMHVDNGRRKQTRERAGKRSRRKEDRYSELKELSRVEPGQVEDKTREKTAWRRNGKYYTQGTNIN